MELKINLIGHIQVNSEMKYKVLIFLCVLGLNACDAKKNEEKSSLKPFINQEENIIKKNRIDLKVIQEGLDNKIYLLLNSEEGCIVSEKPLSNNILIIYKYNENFRYELVKPILKKNNADCVSNLAFVTDEPNYFYDINKKSEQDVRGYGVELNKNQLIYKNEKIRGIDLLGDRIPNIVTECFSKEGSHLNIWGGHNSQEKLLHRYTYLDMDLEATCSDDNQIFSLGTLDLKN